MEIDTHTELFDSLARVLAYPNSEFKNNLSRCREALEPLSNSRKFIETFAGQIESRSLEELEELYTRTFDINPVASLEIGWHLYGETYERGTFLVQMRELLRSVGVEESTELPDHITHVLMAFGRMEPQDSKDFADRSIIPALNKILVGFADKANPYEHLLNAIKIALTEFLPHRSSEA